MENLPDVDYTLTVGGTPLPEEQEPVLSNDDGDELTVPPNVPLTIEDLEGTPAISIKVTGTNIDKVRITPIDENGQPLEPVRT